jgi:3-phytase
MERGNLLPSRRSLRCWSSAVLAAALTLTGTVTAAGSDARVLPVGAYAETAPVAHGGDAADDPTLWIHPDDPGRSLLIGNDKQGALEVYDLDGSRVQRITSGEPFWGNSDVRQRVSIAGQVRDVVAATNNGLRLYTVDRATRRLTAITEGSGPIPTGGGEGLCLYDSRATGDLSAFVITRSGRVRQYLITDADRDRRLTARLVRQFRVGSEAEGCVADDLTGALYISQEDVGLWRYGAEPKTGATRSRIDTVASTGHLSKDVEGLALVRQGGHGYLIASAQNVVAPQESYFVVYRRWSNAYVKSFRITSGGKADGCERTDGIAAYAGHLNRTYPTGVFVCQDNTNRSPGSSGNQNFKLTPLQRIVAPRGR